MPLSEAISDALSKLLKHIRQEIDTKVNLLTLFLQKRAITTPKYEAIAMIGYLTL